MGITIKGYNYYDNHYQPHFTKEYENVGQFIHHIQKVASSKDYVGLPAANKDGTFNQAFARTMNGCLRYSTEYYTDGTINMVCITMITEGDSILFSSGEQTDKGHISGIVKESLSYLKKWKESEYNYAE